MIAIEPTVNCPLYPYPGENKTPLESCAKCPNFVMINKRMQVVCKVGGK
jgi:hypothetical protein